MWMPRVSVRASVLEGFTDTRSMDLAMLPSWAIETYYAWAPCILAIFFGLLLIGLMGGRRRRRQAAQVTDRAQTDRNAHRPETAHRTDREARRQESASRVQASGVATPRDGDLRFGDDDDGDDRAPSWPMLPVAAAATQGKRVLVRDVLYGYIELSPLALCIIDTVEFQGLRDLRQLGLASYVFPSANHTRFEHSLGVYHLVGRLLKELQERQPQLFPADATRRQRAVELVKIAGLCHDIGHFAFSHTFDDQMAAKLGLPHHEERGAKMLQQMVVKYEIPLTPPEVQFIVRLMLGDTTVRPRWLAGLIQDKEAQFDLDKLDYLNRDSFYLGFGKPVQIDRIFLHARVLSVPCLPPDTTRATEAVNSAPSKNDDPTRHRQRGDNAAAETPQNQDDSVSIRTAAASPTEAVNSAPSKNDDPTTHRQCGDDAAAETPQNQDDSVGVRTAAASSVHDDVEIVDGESDCVSIGRRCCSCTMYSRPVIGCFSNATDIVSWSGSMRLSAICCDCSSRFSACGSTMTFARPMRCWPCCPTGSPAFQARMVLPWVRTRRKRQWRCGDASGSATCTGCARRTMSMRPTSASGSACRPSTTTPSPASGSMRTMAPFTTWPWARSANCWATARASHPKPSPSPSAAPDPFLPTTETTIYSRNSSDRLTLLRLMPCTASRPFTSSPSFSRHCKRSSRICAQLLRRQPLPIVRKGTGGGDVMRETRFAETGPSIRPSDTRTAAARASPMRCIALSTTSSTSIGHPLNAPARTIPADGFSFSLTTTTPLRTSARRSTSPPDLFGRVVWVTGPVWARGLGNGTCSGARFG